MCASGEKKALAGDFTLRLCSLFRCVASHPREFIHRVAGSTRRGVVSFAPLSDPKSSLALIAWAARCVTAVTQRMHAGPRRPCEGCSGTRQQSTVNLHPRTRPHGDWPSAAARRFSTCLPRISRGGRILYMEGTAEEGGKQVRARAEASRGGRGGGAGSSFFQPRPLAHFHSVRPTINHSTTTTAPLRSTPPHKMAPFPPQLIELPLLGAALGFAAAGMGLGGADIHDFKSLRSSMASSSLKDFVYLEDNGILTVDLLLLIASAVTFFVALVGLALAARQFPKRRGEYSGKGTSAWLLVGLVFLLLSGLWAGTAAAYTAYAVKYTWSFSAGSGFAQPFTLTQKAYLRAVSQKLVSGETGGSLNVLQSASGATGVTDAYLGEWNVDTLDQANAVPSRYLDYSTKWKAAVIISWFELGTVFLTMVVHFALPFVWKWLGLIRERKPTKQYYSAY